jgi:hypothetical protein
MTTYLFNILYMTVTTTSTATTRAGALTRTADALGHKYLVVPTPDSRSTAGTKQVNRASFLIVETAWT